MGNIGEECIKSLIEQTKEKENIDIKSLKNGLIAMRHKVQVLSAVEQIEKDFKKNQEMKIADAANAIKNATTLEDLNLSVQTMSSIMEDVSMDEIKNTANNIEKVNVLVQAYELIARTSEYIRDKRIDYKILLSGDSINPQQMTTFTLSLNQLLEFTVNEQGQKEYTYFKFDSHNAALRLKTSALNSLRRSGQHPELFEFASKKQGFQKLQQYTAVIQAIYEQRWNIWEAANEKRWLEGKKDNYINRGNIKELFILLQENYPDIFNQLYYDQNGSFIITESFEKTVVDMLKNNILKNTVPFYQGGDLTTLEGEEYQVKGNDATFTDISTVLNILDRFINSLGDIKEGSIRRGMANEDIDTIVNNEIRKFVEQFIAKQ